MTHFRTFFRTDKGSHEGKRGSHFVTPFKYGTRWCHPQRTPSKQNSVEGWHRRLNALTACYCHSLRVVIENFRRQSLIEAVVEQGCSEGPPLERRRRVITGEVVPQ